MTAHGIDHIEKVLLIAQRLGKLSANIAAYWTTVRLGRMSALVKLGRTQCEPTFSGLPSNPDVARCIRHGSKGPKPEISPNTKPLSARRAFSAPHRGYAFSLWQRLSDLASVLGKQQRHQLIDRCRWVAAGREPRSCHSRGAQVVNRKPKYHRLKQM